MCRHEVRVGIIKKIYFSLLLFCMSRNNRSYFCLVVSLLMGGCNSKEITRLQIENDSLRNELISHAATMSSLTDVAIWMDSIDVSRNIIVTNLKDGITSEDLSSRLTNINEFVK